MVVAVSSLKIAYMAVPKAACSSVKAALAVVDPKRDLSLADFESGRVNPHGIFPTMRFRPYRWQQYEGWWRFTVVRDPLKRLLSVYSDRVHKRRELFNSRDLRRQSVLPPDPGPDFFFQNIKEYIQLASVIKHHTLPSHLFIGPRPHLFDRVYRVDELPFLSNDFENRTGISMKLPQLNASYNSLEFSQLTPKTQSSHRRASSPRLRGSG